MSKEITQADRDRLEGKQVVLGMSGGKDSTALAIHLKRNGIDFVPVFMDTGWEHQTTYDYLENVLDPLFGPIVRLQSEKFPGGMVEAVKSKAMFPSRMIRWCTQELKIFPLRDYIRKLQEKTDVVSVVGIRKEESLARSNMPRWEFSNTHDCDVFRPLIDWSEQDVIGAHLSAGVSPNPLYLQGYQRVGCFPCVLARKSEIRKIADDYPERIDQMRDLEREVTQLQVKRHADKGTELKNAPAWFQAKVGRTGECWPIDKVVEWSRTVDHRSQFEMFAPTEYEEQGCVRWGLCEPMKGDPVE